MTALLVPVFAPYAFMFIALTIATIRIGRGRR